MATPVQPVGPGGEKIDAPPPPADVDDAADDGDGQRAPSWHSPWRLVVAALALLFLGGAVGYFISQRESTSHPGADAVDVGFLQDMRYHHDQAVQMSLSYLQKPA